MRTWRRVSGRRVGRVIAVVACCALLLASLACSAGAAGEAGASAQPTDPSGSYTVSGTNPDGSAYNGRLEVVRAGDTYTLTWMVGSNVSGIGVVRGNALAAAYPAESCLIALYDISTGGGLEGSWATAQGPTVSPESAAPMQPNLAGAVAGRYTFSGTAADGSPYQGEMEVSPDGVLYNVTQQSGTADLIGTGIVVGRQFAVSFGTQPGCGVIIYAIGQGQLAGTWGLRSAPAVLGAETATGIITP
ncbi:MAG: hypothetical protein IT326_02350 [Anaerolineae bacterium]|nr:hypothetical protein [Anaerolineae bacterium]